jgi:hypothetical protein
MVEKIRQEPTPESEQIRQAVDAIQAFNRAIEDAVPDGFTDEEWAKVFDELEKIPGAGGGHLISALASRIVEAYQNKTGIPLVGPPKRKR